MKKPRTDTDDWCMDDAKMKDYEVIRCIRSSVRWKSYLARDKAGSLITLTYFDKEKIGEHFRTLTSKDGIPEDNLAKETAKHVKEYHENIRQAVERIRGLGGDHVAKTYGLSFDRERDQMVIVSEYIPGIDIFYASGRLTPLQLINLFAQSLDGIAFIHKSGFLHLNVKPSRIYVNLDDEFPAVKITDFGFAVPIKNYKGKYSGTTFYMAPEVVLERRDKIDTRADLFSMAVTMYYCLTGFQPLGERLIAKSDRNRFTEIVAREKDISTPPSRYKPEVPAELDELILKLLKKDPDERGFKKAGDVLNYIYEKWPKESKVMARECTSTLLSYD